MEKITAVLIAIVLTFAVVGWFGIFWTMNMSDIDITHEIKMDDNTREYLVEHDYCVQIKNPPFDSNESDVMFIGDCEYLDYSLFK